MFWLCRLYVKLWLSWLYIEFRFLVDECPIARFKFFSRDQEYQSLDWHSDFFDSDSFVLQSLAGFEVPQESV